METLGLVLNGFVVNECEEILGCVTGVEIKHGRMFIHILEGVLDHGGPDGGNEEEIPEEPEKNTEQLLREALNPETNPGLYLKEVATGETQDG